MANESSVTWVAKGRTLEGRDDPKLLPIDITEYPKSYSQQGNEQPYGIPIDAPLGVQLIKDLWAKVKELFPDQKAFSEWAHTVLTASFAFGFDKNVLLKTLSQPKCEGVRFYLCLKTDPDTPDEPGVLSLVTVGVDAEGKDLLYEFNDAVHKSGLANIETRSMLAEYGFPPGVAKVDPVNLDPFVLFKYSQ